MPTAPFTPLAPSPFSPHSPHSPSQTASPIQAADQRRRTADPHWIERIEANGRSGFGWLGSRSFFVSFSPFPALFNRPALDRLCAPAAAFLVGPFFSCPRSFLFFGARRSKPAADSSSNYARGKGAGPRALSRRLEASAKKNNEERRTERDRGRKGCGTGAGDEREMKGKQAEKKGTKNPNRLRDAKAEMLCGLKRAKNRRLGAQNRAVQAGRPYLPCFLKAAGDAAAAKLRDREKERKKKKRRRSGAFSFCKPPQSGKPFRTYPRSAHRTAAIGSRLPPDRSNPSKSCCA